MKQTKKTVAIGMCIFLLVNMTFAQVKDTINGIVHDSLSNAPLDSAIVASQGFTVATKADGTFSLVISSTQTQSGSRIAKSQKVYWNNNHGFSWIGGAADVLVRVVNAQGCVVAKKCSAKGSGENLLSIEALPQGMYVVSIFYAGHTDTYRFMRIRGTAGITTVLMSRVYGSDAPMLAKSLALTKDYELIVSKKGYSSDTLTVAKGTQASALVKVQLLAALSSLNIPWDWIGLVGTGQSLSVGVKAPTILSTAQPFNNLKLSTGTLPWKISPDDPVLKLVPLIEPIGRLTTAYPSGYPDHIKGETPHSAMANEITSLVKAAGGKDYVGIHGAYGEDGQCMKFLKKNATQSGVNGRAFAATIMEVTAINRLAKAAGKTYGIGGIILTHGECDANSSSYENEMYQLCNDYNTDISAITGQKQIIQMLVSQQHTQSDRAPSTIAEWKVGVDHPQNMVCSGPKYQYPYATDYLHLTSVGYQMLGEKCGEVYFERIVRGRNWQPLQPTTTSRSAAVITVHFNIPNAPMVWETTFSNPHPNTAAWKNGKGFEVTTSSGTAITINTVEISGDAVVITCANDPGANARVSYALYKDQTQTLLKGPSLTGTIRWGLLRDSDPFIGYSTKKAQPNYCVAFELTVP